MPHPPYRFRQTFMLTSCEMRRLDIIPATHNNIESGLIRYAFERHRITPYTDTGLINGYALTAFRRKPMMPLGKTMTMNTKTLPTTMRYWSV